MRRTIRNLFYLIFVICFIFFCIKPLIIFSAKWQLKKVFPNSQVNLAGCSLGFNRLTLAGIKIERPALYNFQVQELSIYFNFWQIIRGNILKIAVNDVRLSVTMPNNGISEMAKLIKLGSGRAFLITALDLSRAKLDLNFLDLQLKAGFGLRVNLLRQLLDSLDLEIDSLAGQGVSVQGVKLKVSQGTKDGWFALRLIKKDKAKVENITATVRLADKMLFLDNLHGELLGGDFHGSVKFKLEENPGYSLALNLRELDLARLVDEFNLQEKIKLSGKLTGDVVLAGEGRNIRLISGELYSSADGGLLTINDDRYLKEVARNSGQSFDILVESFKNYHYNKGTANLSLDKGNLIFKIDLDGASGKRQLNVTVHNLIPEREAQ
jgi:hypothetical protein